MWLAACGSTPMVTLPPVPSSATQPPLATVEPGGSGVAVDISLLDLLPPSVDGLPVMPSPESDVVAAADPAVVANGEAVATGLVLDPEAQTFAYATLVRLRPDTFDDALFRSWRDSFDSGACERAGGVTGHAEAVIGGHQTFIGSCEAGIRTHHVWLPEPRVLVSVSSAASGRLGEALIGGLDE
jgi:hypothetical protein